MTPPWVHHTEPLGPYGLGLGTYQCRTSLPNACPCLQCQWKGEERIPHQTSPLPVARRTCMAPSDPASQPAASAVCLWMASVVRGRQWICPGFSGSHFCIYTDVNQYASLIVYKNCRINCKRKCFMFDILVWWMMGIFEFEILSHWAWNPATSDTVFCPQG